MRCADERFAPDMAVEELMSPFWMFVLGLIYIVAVDTGGWSVMMAVK